MKLFISYRRSNSSFVGEIFEYLESKGKFDGFSHDLTYGPRDYHPAKDSAETLLSSFTRPFNTRQVISAVNSALEIYESRQATRRMLSLLRYPFHVPRWPLNKRDSRPWRGGAVADGFANLPALAYSDAQVFLLSDLSAFWDNSTSNPRMGRYLKLPNLLAIAGDIGRGMLNSGGKPSPEAPKAAVFTGRRLDVESMAEVINPDTLHIDYCNLSSMDLDWPGAEFLLQMHSDAAADGTAASLSAWRQTNDPLSTGVFFGDAGPLAEPYNAMPHILLHTQKKHGIWPTWLRFLFHFRIRKRLKSNRTHIYSMGKAATLRAFANRHFRRATRYRPVRPRLQTLGQLFIGSGGTLEVGWDLRRRAEQLVRTRLASFPAGRSSVFADADTVYALYRGNCGTGSKNGSCK